MPGPGWLGLRRWDDPQPDSRPQEVEQVTFSTALAGLTDHLVVSLQL